MTVLLQDSKSSRLQAGKREKTWKVIRGLPSGFTCDEVVMLSEVSYHLVSSFLFILYQAGYVRQAGKKEDESGKKRIVWRLAKNTGPKAPVPCRCLYDPNIDDMASGSVIPRLDRGIQKAQKLDRPIKSDDDKKKKEPRHVD